jgi:hypothetical protein
LEKSKTGALVEEEREGRFSHISETASGMEETVAVICSVSPARPLMDVGTNTRRETA